MNIDFDKPVPLVRRFFSVIQSDDDSDEHEIRTLSGYPNSKTWQEIDTNFRTVILAEAGAGKTHEMQARARFVEKQSRPSFFIRIEDIEDAFEDSFEIGTTESFERWLNSQDEAWFFLDSVDEARLKSPTFFRRAIRHFATRIRSAQMRAHVCISSRPHAWQAKSDRYLVQQLLPFAAPLAKLSEEDFESIEQAEHPSDALEILVLQPLEEDDIREFAEFHSIPNIDGLIQELERINLNALAGRVFDLVEILDKWNEGSTLGSRKELMHHGVERRLREQNPDRVTLQPLSPAKARSGARALAAAVILSGKANIHVPGGPQTLTGIDPQNVLADRKPADVQNLLSKAVFDGVVYGAVRFHDREVRELLAAEWFADLLQQGHSRDAIERLFFREQYGVEFVSPRLRVVLPWIVLEDQEIRNRILATNPEIAVEGGDPALLPFQERKNILADVVERIAHGADAGAADGIHAIARIAQSDLAPEARILIDRHFHNDDAITFLGRLVWQGSMTECVPRLLDLLAEPTRRVSARTSTVRAVMTCGSDTQRLALWNLVRATRELPREVLAELLHHAEADADTIPPLLESIERLAPYNEFQITGLSSALHGFIDRLPMPHGTDAEQPLIALVSGLNDLLSRQPFVDWEMCRISEKFVWLLGSAIHSVERLVIKRSKTAMCEPALAILINTPGASRWHGRDFCDFKVRLSELVPVWPELNDRLFWENVRVARIRLEENGEKLNDDWQVQWTDHYWHFGSDSFSRIVEWVNARELRDDQMVALSLAYRVYHQSEKPTQWLKHLHSLVRDDSGLAERLSILLNPPESEDDLQWQQRREERKRKLERKNLKRQQQKLDWIGHIKANPELIRNPPGLQPGKITWDQWWLLREAMGDDHPTDRIQGANWRSLIDKFGEDVAIAYRDAAIAHWRHYEPGLGSEGAETKSTPYPVHFGMTGLAIEAAEVKSFHSQLCSSEVRVALRYMVWELNGFPPWLEAMYQAHPAAVMEAVETELLWELTNTNNEQAKNYILHDLAAYAPWLHSPLASLLMTWLHTNDPPSVNSLCNTLRILNGGCSNPEELAALAKAKANRQNATEYQPYWYAVWVDADPEAGIEAVEHWLVLLETEKASKAAQLFISALMGSHYDLGVGRRFVNLQTPEYLKRLYVLMHQHIRMSDDIERVGMGAYTPELRDSAQDARNRLFQILSEIPGKEAYIALRELIADHPESDLRPWMAKQAFKRAQVDGDIEPWTTEQVYEFSSGLTATPATQRQLFDLTIARVTDLKNWLERGDDSQYRTWQKADDENEIRNLVASSLNRLWGNPFTTAQEPELSNKQRVDICLQTPTVQFPIPIELKLLDQGWSGPKLCERLQNQLAGDYLREGNERCGLMLLVWQGLKNSELRWQFDGKLIGVSELCHALKQYWNIISKSYPNIAAIEVILIDLTVREPKSEIPIRRT